jgi:hypothetical protein
MIINEVKEIFRLYICVNFLFYYNIKLIYIL